MLTKSLHFQLRIHQLHDRIWIMQLNEIKPYLERLVRNTKATLRYRHGTGVHEPIYLEDSEIKRILEFAATNVPRGVTHGIERNTALLTLAIYTGLRVRELHSLNRENLDLEHRWVRVEHGKGNKYRRVPLNQETVDVLQKYLDLRGVKNDELNTPVFISRTGKRMAVRTIQWLVETYGEGAEIKKVRDGKVKKLSPHKLRHTFGTQLARRDVQPVKIKNMMGHSSQATTERYVHASGGHEDVEGLTKEAGVQDVNRIERLEQKFDRLADLIERKLQ